MNYLSINDLHDHSGEARVQDTVLGMRLGFSRAEKVRELVARNIDELLSYGGLPCHGVNPGAQGGRPSKAYFLNEPQALLICMFSRTPLAADVRRQVIEVFMAWREGRTVAVRDHHRRPPGGRSQVTVKDAGGPPSTIAELIEAHRKAYREMTDYFAWDPIEVGRHVLQTREDIAAENLLYQPCVTLEDVRLKAAYVASAPNLGGDMGSQQVRALLCSLAA